MKEIGQGIYSREANHMPCGPRDFGFMKYAFPGTLGRAEPEEAASRLIYFSRQCGQWVGVAWSRLHQEMRAEVDSRDENNRIAESARQELWTYEQEKKRRFWRSVFTLGVYALFVPAPQEPDIPEPPHYVKITGVFMEGPRCVMQGMGELEDQGLVDHLTTGEGEEREDIFFPRPELINRILSKQGR